MMLRSPYSKRRLAPRCWLNTAPSRKGLEELGCSPIKVLRALSSERCETVRFLPSMKKKHVRT